MDVIIDSVRNFIRNNNLITPRLVVYAAVSGGADSMAMLSMLRAVRQNIDFVLKAAHFEHGLRGERSRQDAKLVSTYCRNHNIELVTGYGHIGRYGIPKGYGVEEWAREQRYAFFDSLCTGDTTRIATAHTMNDQVETVLFNLIRGCGSRGAAGIQARRGAYVRPLLELDRPTVEAYCNKNDIAYVQDETNEALRYSRNRIRRQVIPVLNDINPGALNNVACFAQKMRILDEWLCSQAAFLMGTAEVTQDKWGYDREFDLQHFNNVPQPVLASFFSLLLGTDVYQGKLQELCEVVYGTRRKVQVSARCFVQAVGNRLVVSCKAATGAMDLTLQQDCVLQEADYRFAGGYVFTVQVTHLAGGDPIQDEIVGKGLKFVADYDKINQCSVFRARRPGDWVRLQRRGVRKPLRKWMNEERIPIDKRDVLPLLADDQEIIWVYGKNFLGNALPDENTTRFLCIVCGS